MVFEPEGEGSIGCTFLEWVIDFELSTGLRVIDHSSGTETPWNRKAELFRIMYTCLCKKYKHYSQPTIVKRCKTSHALEDQDTQVLPLNLDCWRGKILKWLLLQTF